MITIPGYSRPPSYYANNISITPVGDLSSTNLQDGLQELDSDLSGGLSSKLDTSAYTAPGLEFITLETFTGVSSISVNDCFTSTYDKYRILIEIPGHTNSANTIVWFRLRASGTDYSAANYNVGYHYTLMNSTATGGDLNAISSTYGYVFSAVGSSGGIGNHGSFDLINPRKSGAYKYFYGQYVAMQASSAVYGYTMFNQVSNTDAYDGITLTIASGTMSGNIQVYGYRKQ